MVFSKVLPERTADDSYTEEYRKVYRMLERYWNLWFSRSSDLSPEELWQWYREQTQWERLSEEEIEYLNQLIKTHKITLETGRP